MVTDHVLYLEITLQKSEKDLIFNHKFEFVTIPTKIDHVYVFYKAFTQSAVFLSM